MNDEAELLQRRNLAVECFARSSNDHSALGRMLFEAEMRLVDDGPPAAWHLSPIRRPVGVIILGPPRSGTTLLHHLLALHEDALWISAGRASHPTLFGTAVQTERLLRRRHLVQQLSPSLLGIHNILLDGPEECNVALLHTVGSFQWAVQYRLPGFLKELVDADLRRDARWLVSLAADSVDRPVPQRVGEPKLNKTEVAEFTLLKSPAHGLMASAFAEIFDRVVFVQIDRKAAEVQSSWMKLMSAARRVSTGRSDVAASEAEEWWSFFDACENASARVRRKYEGNPAKSFVSVDYAHLRDTPLTTARMILERAGLPPTVEWEERVRRYLIRDPLRGGSDSWL